LEKKFHVGRQLLEKGYRIWRKIDEFWQKKANPFFIFAAHE